MSKYQVLKIGTDAEVFLVDGHNIPVPACGLVGGTKENPLPVPELGEGFAVQEDNVMLEFNLPAATSAMEFVANLDMMMAHIKKTMGSKGLLPVAQSAMMFKEKQLDSEQARTFGCEPDFCVWTRTPNKIDKSNPIVQTMRSAAAHIHISYLFHGEKPEIENMEPVIKALDFFLGAPSVMRFPSSPRRKLYGKAGSFRPKEYGVEYRVLGNEWIGDSGHVQWVFDRIHNAFDFLNYFGDAAGTLDGFQGEIVSGINEENYKHLSEIDAVGKHFLQMVASKIRFQQEMDEFYAEMTGKQNA